MKVDIVIVNIASQTNLCPGGEPSGTMCGIFSVASFTIELTSAPPSAQRAVEKTGPSILWLNRGPRLYPSKVLVGLCGKAETSAFAEDQRTL